MLKCLSLGTQLSNIDWTAQNAEFFLVQKTLLHRFARVKEAWHNKYVGPAPPMAVSNREMELVHFP